MTKSGRMKQQWQDPAFRAKMTKVLDKARNKSHSTYPRQIIRAKHGELGLKLYNLLQGIICRCESPSHHKYAGRGIREEQKRVKAKDLKIYPLMTMGYARFKAELIYDALEAIPSSEPIKAWPWLAP